MEARTEARTLPLPLWRDCSRVYLTVGNRPGYRGNQPYRRGSVEVTDRFFDKTEPTKPPYSVNRSKTSVNRTGFVGFENHYCTGFLNPRLQSAARRRPL
jgi:hypothetical protein